MTSCPCARWAPDGRWAAFAADDGIRIIDTTTGYLRLLSGDQWTDFDWRPGTDELAITGLGESEFGNTPISVYSVSTGQTRTVGDVQAREMTWSPDGETIAYTQEVAPAATSAIWLVDADGTDVRQLTTDTWSGQDVSWSPRGDLIAYVQSCDGEDPEVAYEREHPGIDITEAPGDSECNQRVPRSRRAGDATDDDPAAPIGTEVVLAPPVTETRVGTVMWFPQEISWLPDGTQLLFTMYDGGLLDTHSSYAGIAVVPIDTSRPTSDRHQQSLEAVTRERFSCRGTPTSEQHHSTSTDRHRDGWRGSGNRARRHVRHQGTRPLSHPRPAAWHDTAQHRAPGGTS